MTDADFDDEAAEISPLDERFPKWQPSGGGNGVMRAVFGLLYEHGPMTRNELADQLAESMSMPALAYVRRCYLHNLGARPLRRTSMEGSLPARDPVRELRAYLSKNLSNARRNGTLAPDGGTVDTRRWHTTATPPRFTVDPDAPPVPYTAERHAEWLTRERAVTDKSIASMDVQIYATAPRTELERWALLAAFTAARRDALADTTDLRSLGLARIVARFKQRPPANQAAVIAALAAQLADTLGEP
jgi:hypothetical protein